MAYLTGALPLHAQAAEVRSPAVPSPLHDTVAAVITFADGSVGTLLYAANGDVSLPKEYCEVSAGGRSAIMNNFTEVSFHAGGKRTRRRYDGQKGHAEEVGHFLAVIAGKEEPSLSFDTMEAVTRVTFDITRSLQGLSECPDPKNPL